MGCLAISPIRSHPRCRVEEPTTAASHPISEATPFVTCLATGGSSKLAGLPVVNRCQGLSRVLAWLRPRYRADVKSMDTPRLSGAGVHPAGLLPAGLAGAGWPLRAEQAAQ